MLPWIFIVTLFAADGDVDETLVSAGYRNKATCETRLDATTEILRRDEFKDVRWTITRCLQLRGDPNDEGAES